MTIASSCSCENKETKICPKNSNSKNKATSIIM